MNRYTMLSTDMLYDQRSRTTVGLGGVVEPYTVDIPFYLWWHRRKFGSWAEFPPYCEGDKDLLRSMVVQLNDLTITLTKKFGVGWIVFIDKRTGQECKLAIKTKKDIYRNSLNGATLHVWVNGEEISSRNTYTALRSTISFFPVLSLGQRRVPFCDESFSYGVRCTRWNMRYHGQSVNRQQYAFLCGFWGILLNDDLSFNSLVSITAVRASTVQDAYLDIGKILYTVDSGMVKTQMLIKYAS